MYIGFAVVLATLLVAPAALPAEDGFSARYLVFSVDAAGKVKPLFNRLVRLAVPLRSRTAEEMESLRHESSREEEGVEVQLLDGDNQIIFQDLLRVPQWIRGEFHGVQEAQGGWTIEAHRFPWDPQVFVVRVPPTGARLSLVFAGQHRKAVGAVTFDLNDLEGRKDLLRIALPLATGPKETAAMVTGSPDNRMDLLIMGDGYTAAQAEKFNTDAANLEASVFDLAPYSQYKNYVNRVTLFTASAQSGADHPPYNSACAGDNPSCCADPTVLSDPQAGTYVSTAFGGRFCSFNIHRLVGMDSAAVFAAASAYPDWDRILVLVNDATYGGSGGTISVTSTHALAVDIVRHEHGHSFTGLADEYDSPFPGFPSCSDISAPPCEPNVTDQTSSPLIKWLPWISAGTPIPTPEGNPAYANTAGLFQGARYQSTGMYRHRDTECLMNFLGKSFGEVCSQEYILRLYRGGLGRAVGRHRRYRAGFGVPSRGFVSRAYRRQSLGSPARSGRRSPAFRNLEGQRRGCTGSHGRRVQFPAHRTRDLSGHARSPGHDPPSPSGDGGISPPEFQELVDHEHGALGGISQRQ